MLGGKSVSRSSDTIHDTLPDGNFPFAVKRQHIVNPRSSESAKRIVFVNGLFESRGFWNTLTSRMANIALERGDNLELITYDDPRTGKSAYAQDYRNERLSQVVQYVVSADRHDRPVVLKAHSRGWITTAKTAPQLAAEQKVSGIIGTGVAGHTPRPPEEVTVRSVVALTRQEIFSAANVRVGLGGLAMLGSIARELPGRLLRDPLHAPEEMWALATRDIPAVRSELGGLATLGTLVDNGARHLLGNLWQAHDEIATIMTADISKEVAELSEGLPAHVWACLRDPYCPGEGVVSNLQASGFAGGLVRVDTTHCGPLIDATLAEALYDDVFALTAEPARLPPQAA